MAQTSRQQSPWGPPVQTTNPDAFMPPAKRQRLSPNPASPYSNPSTPYAGTPNLANFAIPSGAFNNTRPNGVPQQSSAPAPGNTTGAMGPPQRPAERTVEKLAAPKDDRDRAVDVNELNDTVHAAGIDLKHEEDFLNASYRSARGGQQTSSQGTTISQTSFDLLSQGSFGNLGTARSSFAQPQPKQTEEEELYAKHKNAARLLAESVQLPLQTPFLWAASLRQRMQVAAQEHGIQIPISGLWDRIADKPDSMSGTSMRDANGHGIQVTRAPSMLSSNAPLEPMISLLSLAGNERVRTLLEDAYGIARGRQIGSDGIVPSDWTDVATGESKAEQTLITPQSISGTAWDAPKETPSSNPTATTPSKRKKPEAVPTTAYSQSKLNQALNALTQADRQAEEARLRAREARRKKKATTSSQPTNSQNSADTASQAAPLDAAAPTPAFLGEKAPEVKLSKKEREKAAKQDISEEVAAREANATATMQIGGKQYSWLQGAKKKPTPAAAAAANQTKSAISKAASAAAVAAAPAKPTDELDGLKDRKFGNWREDGVGGRGVQLRDWIGVLEQDGHEKKTLLNAYVKLDAALGGGSKPNNMTPVSAATATPSAPLASASSARPITTTSTVPVPGGNPTYTPQSSTGVAAGSAPRPSASPAAASQFHPPPPPPPPVIKSEQQDHR